MTKDFVINKKPTAKKDKFDVNESAFNDWAEAKKEEIQEVKEKIKEEVKDQEKEKTMALHIVINEEAHAQFKMYCISKRISMKQKIEEMIEDLVKK